MSENALNSRFKRIRHVKKRLFLIAYSETGNLSFASEVAGIDRSTHYVWLKNDVKYAEAYEQAKDIAADALELEARRRAVEGVDEPVYYKGRAVGAVRKFSDTLLIVLLKGVMPEKYKDRQDIKHSGGLAHKHDLTSLSDDELRQILDG